MTTQPHIHLERQIHLEKWLDKAIASLATGMVGDAADAIHQALAQSPESDQARLLEARIELARNDPAQALAALDAHDLHHPDHRDKPELDLLRAEALCRAGHWQMAQRLLGKLATSFPDDVRFHRLLAEVYLSEAQPDNAQIHLREILRLVPSDDVSRRLLIDLLAQTSPQESASLLQNMLKPNTADQANARSTDTLVLLRMARLYHQTSRDRDAEEIYRQLLVTEAGDAQLWLEAGQLAEAMGATSLALERLTQAERLAGRLPGSLSCCLAHEVLGAKAMSLMRSGKLAQAGQLWWRLFRSGENQVEAAGGLLVCALALGRGRIVRMAHRQLAIHASRLERRKMVMRLWTQAAGGKVVAQSLNMTLRVTDQAHQSLLGPLLEQSVKKLVKHAADAPDRADTQFHLAVCQLATGDATAATGSAMRALDLNPRYIAAAQLYAKLDSIKRNAA